MRALIFSEVGSLPTVGESSLPTLAAGEARIKMDAAALNHRDLYITQGQYPGIETPSVLGSDGVGVVEAVGSDSDSGWIGKSVLLNPSLNWGDDPRFQGPEYSILGMPSSGTMADYVHIPMRNLIAKPPHLSSAEAAALPLAGLTAWRALVTRGEVKAGDRVLISGIGGGVALSAMQFAMALGAEVYVTSSSAEKIAKAADLGAAGGALYTETDWRKTVKRMAGGDFDVIVDGAGGEGFADLARLLAPGGRLVFYGGTRGKWAPILPQWLFFRQVSILASTMGSPQDFEAMVACVDANEIKPVVDSVWELSVGSQAFERLQSGQHFGKVVIQVTS